MKNTARLIFTLCALWVAAGHAAPVGLGDLPAKAPADVIILGEIHDNPTHHAHQAELVARWKPTAIVFEMLTAAQAEAAQDVDRTDAAAMAQAFDWANSGWPDYALYHPIFAASGTAKLYGAALDRADVRRAMTEGAAAIFGKDAARFGLATALDDAEQAAREVDQQTAHCNALPAEMLPGMVAAQRLRDAAFAKTALTALAETGGPVIIITGTGHADKRRGIPAAIAVAAPSVSLFSLGQLEGDPGPDAPYHRWIITTATPRDDPCAAFR